MNFTWNSRKDWKDKKKYSQKSVNSYFAKTERSSPPTGAMQKKLVSDEDFQEKIKLTEEQKQRETEEKKQRKRERRREIAARNKELKRIKKAKKDKEDEKLLLCRFRKLNASFGKMKEHRKLNNKNRKILL